MTWWNPFSWGRRRAELTPWRLDEINNERWKRKRRLLTMDQAKAALGTKPADDDGMDFLIGLAGVPYPSQSGIVGYSISQLNQQAYLDAHEAHRSRQTLASDAAYITGASSAHNHRADDSWTSSHHSPSHSGSGHDHSSSSDSGSSSSSYDSGSSSSGDSGGGGGGGGSD